MGDFKKKQKNNINKILEIRFWTPNLLLPVTRQWQKLAVTITLLCYLLKFVKTVCKIFGCFFISFLWE